MGQYLILEWTAKSLVAGGRCASALQQFGGRSSLEGAKTSWSILYNLAGIRSFGNKISCLLRMMICVLKQWVKLTREQLVAYSITTHISQAYCFQYINRIFLFIGLPSCQPLRSRSAAHCQRPHRAARKGQLNNDQNSLNGANFLTGPIPQDTNPV